MPPSATCMSSSTDILSKASSPSGDGRKRGLPNEADHESLRWELQGFGAEVAHRLEGETSSAGPEDETMSGAEVASARPLALVVINSASADDAAWLVARQPPADWPSAAELIGGPARDMATFLGEKSLARCVALHLGRYDGRSAAAWVRIRSDSQWAQRAKERFAVNLERAQWSDAAKAEVDVLLHLGATSTVAPANCYFRLQYLACVLFAATNGELSKCLTWCALSVLSWP